MGTQADQAGYYRGTVDINYGQYGWSESLDLFAADDAAAQALMFNYIRHRMWILPASCIAVYARIVKVPFVRYTVPLSNLPIVGKAPNLTAPNVLDMDSVERSLTLNMPCDQGGKAIRFIHGLPDDTINAQTLLTAAPGGTWLDLITDPGDGSATPATIAAGIKNVFSYILQKTHCATPRQTKLIGGVPTQVYQLRAYTGLLLRGVRNKKVGRAFGLSRGRAAIH